MCKDNDYILHSYAIWQLFSPFGKSPRTAAGSVRRDFCIASGSLIAAYRPFFVVPTRCVHACLQV